MKKKMFLTSAIAMGFVAPAFAAPSHTDAFPDDGYMQEDYTYTNAATATNMDSVYEGSVNAVAEYEDIFYDIVAGNYLAAGSDDEDGTICPAGSYCSGLTHAPYNATSDQGKTSCPTIDDATFTSDAGSSAVTSCYQENSAMSTALLNPVTIAHLNTSVSGNGYINGVKYKSATTAARRYATTATTAGEWAALDESDLEIEDLACENGYHYKAGTTAPNLNNIIGTVKGVAYGYQNDSTGQYGAKSEATEKYGITEDQTWAAEFSYGVVRGKALCSTTEGEWATTGTPDESTGKGPNCWCQIDGFTPTGGSKQSLSGAWVFHPDTENADNCAESCAYYCARTLWGKNVDFRAALLGSVQPTPAMCEANTITINWSNADADDVTANNAGTATYGSDVRTPVKANTYKGKTFKGWKFSKPTTTQL